MGAVYRSDEADVVLVDAQGGTAEIGHNAAPGLAADPERGWVFWLTYNQQLVVFDARHGLPVRTRLAIEPIDSFRFARPLALTDGTAYYLTRRTVRAWDVAAQPGDHRGLGPRPGVPRAERRPRGGPGPRPPRHRGDPRRASACGDATA